MGYIIASALKGETYRFFIDEAVKRSEYIEFDVLHVSEKACSGDNDYFNALKSKRKAKEYESYYLNFLKGYNNVLLPFVNNLGYKLSKTDKPFNTIERVFMKINKEMINTLYEPECIMNWIAPCYPENLKLIKDEHIWFFYITYENHARIYYDSNEDFDYWKTNGIKNQVAFCYNEGDRWRDKHHSFI